MFKFFSKYCLPIFIPFFLFSQEQDYRIEYLTTNSGLSSNYVTKIISDQSNFKWIATENGISIYNGNQFEIEVIKTKRKFLSGILNENIETLYKDSNNLIWIGTKSGGLSSINPVTFETQNYNSIIGISEKNTFRIFAISEDKHGRIWVGTFSNGVFVINPGEQKIIHHFNKQESVQSIFNDSSGNVWFSSTNKLNVFHLDKNIVESFDTYQIGDITEDIKRNRLLFISAGGQLNELDFKTKAISKIKKFPSSFNPTMSFDNFGKLWIGTWRFGLFVSDDKVENFKKINLVKPNSRKLKINYSTINDIEHSSDNTTWLSMANGGVVKLSPVKPFKSLIELTSSFKLNQNKNIKSVLKDKDDLYVGTFNLGLFSIDNDGNLKSYGLKGEKINVLRKYKDNILIGTQNGLYSLGGNKKLKKINIPGYNSPDYESSSSLMRLSNFPSFAVLSIFIDSLDNIWIGTQQNGLIFAEENKFFSNNFIKIKPEKLYDNSRRITEIKEDKYGNIWIGTYNGLYLVNKNKNLISHRNFSNFYLPEIINDFVIDEFMWLATANGVFKLDYQKNIDNSYKLSLVETLDLNNGLDNEFINSIVKVENNTSELGSYWFSSMIKVVNYNEKSGGLIEYGGMDGIDVQMFNLGASFQHNDDKIYFGASNDLIELDLKKISKDKNDGKVIFTHLKINQSKIYPNQEYNDRIVLNKNLSYLNEITLTDKERSFSVGFVNNDFNERNKFAYKLIGYQDQWINLGHVKEIDFTGLSSSLFSDGKYKLIVASSLDNVNWENSSELLINIKPSPFLSFPALMIYILTLILLFYLIIRIYSNGLKLKSSLINSEKDKKREMDFAESKLGFFTNISHEFRTPLTLIISPIQEILNSTDLKANVSNKLTTVEKNANKLLNLINELLDFRKADQGLLKIKVAYGNFKNFSHEIFLLFNELAKSKNIEYEFICNEDEINLPFDRNKIEIVISNLISNALKFTPSGGKITVMVSSANGYCNCSVRDTGIGIPVKDVDKIFDEFYMVKSKLKNQTPGTGIGLFLSKKIIELHHGSINVLSDYGDGSEFIFSISMDANNYREVDLNFKKSEDLSVYHLENNTNSINNVSIESRETILVIDDNKDIRTYLNSLLSDNYEIIEAENGEVGLKLALSKIPDLIISDIMMPVMDGIELCSKLKKELSTSHIPIILLTARNSTLFEVSGFESGADDYITKPFKANILKARVTSLLDNRNNTRKHLLNKVRFEPVIDPNSNDDVEIGFIEKAIVLVEENIQNPNFGIDKMTDYFCMSQSTLYRKIKSLTGLSLTAFIRSVRLKKAAYLISTTDTKLTYVCYEVGFNDYKYFRTSFKQQFGCLPSKYKSSKVDTINQNI